jgi:hypothetical protein
MGEIIGSFYSALGVKQDASNETIKRGAEKFETRSRYADCPQLTPWVSAEATRVLTDPVLRSEYDERLRLNTKASWPTPWPFDISIAEQGLPPLVRQKFCDRCGGFPAVDATIPQVIPSPAVLEDRLPGGIAEGGGAVVRGASRYVKRRCCECGQHEVAASLRKQGVLIGALTIGDVVAAVLAVWPLVFLIGLVLVGLLLGHLAAWVRYRRLAPVQRIPRLS